MRYSRLGELESARRDLESALEVYEAIGDVRGVAQVHGTLGSIKAREGNPTEAWGLFENALDIAREAKDQWLTAQILREFANSRLEEGDALSAFDLANEASTICEAHQMEDLKVGIDSLRARALLGLGRTEAALEASNHAIDHMKDGIELAHLIHYTHALVLLASNQYAEGHRHLVAAHRVLMEIVSDLDTEEQERAVRRVPDHMEIVRHWRTLKPEVHKARLAAASAPTGRPLTPNEYRDIQWTLSSPADMDIEDKVERRRSRVARLVAEAADQGAAPTVPDLAKALEASEATIRRDLAALRDAGVAAPTRGSRSINPDD